MNLYSSILFNFEYIFFDNKWGEGDSIQDATLAFTILEFKLKILQTGRNYVIFQSL